MELAWPGGSPETPPFTPTPTPKYMAADFIPPKDPDFDTWQAAFVTWCDNNGLTHSLTAPQLSDLAAEAAAWGYSWTGFQNLQTAFHGATQDKGVKRASLEALCRQYAVIINANAATTNQERVDAGLTPRSGTRTPAPVPVTTPTMQKIDTSTRAILRLFIADSTTPEKLAKPPGVRACEVWEQIGGTAPTDPTTMDYLAAESRMPYRADFAQGDVGKTVYFALRWVNTTNAPGPWSQIFPAVIPG